MKWRNEVAACGVTFALMTAIVSTQQPFQANLAKAQIAAAIDEGSKLRLHQVGAYIQLSLLARAGDPEGFWGNHFGASIYTPTEWLKLQAAIAHQGYKPFSEKDVTADMARPVLRVFVRGGTSLKNVFVRREKGDVVQPLMARDCAEAMPFDRDMDGDCKEYQFKLSDVEGIRDLKGEFLIAVQAMVIRSGHQQIDERNLVVKQKDLKRLP